MPQDKHTDEIAVCVINFHQRELTRNCLHSLKQQTDSRFFVYLLDNDTTGEMTATDLNPFPFVQYESSIKNTGFAGGNNILIKEALQNRHPYIILLNNDTEVDPTFIHRFRNTLQKTNPFDIVGCIITYLKSPRQIWFAGGRLFPFVYLTQHLRMDQPVTSRPKGTLGKTDWITGCVLAASATLYQKIGVFDESFFAYLEDLDLCLRAQAAGGHCWVINTPLVKHAVSPAVGAIGTNRMTDQRLFFQARNSAYIIRRHSRSGRLSLWLNCLAQCAVFTFKRRMALRQIPGFFKTALTAY